MPPKRLSPNRKVSKRRTSAKRGISGRHRSAMRKRVPGRHRSSVRKNIQMGSSVVENSNADHAQTETSAGKADTKAATTDTKAATTDTMTKGRPPKRRSYARIAGKTGVKLAATVAAYELGKEFTKNAVNNGRLPKINLPSFSSAIDKLYPDTLPNLSPADDIVTYEEPDATPANATPANATPANTTPANATPANTTPANTTPANAKISGYAARSLDLARTIADHTSLSHLKKSERNPDAKQANAKQSNAKQANAKQANATPTTPTPVEPEAEVKDTQRDMLDEWRDAYRESQTDEKRRAAEARVRRAAEKLRNQDPTISQYQERAKQLNIRLDDLKGIQTSIFEDQLRRERGRRGLKGTAKSWLDPRKYYLYQVPEYIPAIGRRYNNSIIDPTLEPDVKIYVDNEQKIQEKRDMLAYNPYAPNKIDLEDEINRLEEANASLMRKVVEDQTNKYRNQMSSKIISEPAKRTAIFTEQLKKAKDGLRESVQHDLVDAYRFQYVDELDKINTDENLDDREKKEERQLLVDKYKKLLYSAVTGAMNLQVDSSGLQFIKGEPGYEALQEQAAEDALKDLTSPEDVKIRTALWHRFNPWRNGQSQPKSSPRRKPEDFFNKHPEESNEDTSGGILGTGINKETGVGLATGALIGAGLVGTGIAIYNRDKIAKGFRKLKNRLSGKKSVEPTTLNK